MEKFKKDHLKALEDQKQDFEIRIDKLREENAATISARNLDLDKLLKVEEIIDGK